MHEDHGWGNDQTPTLCAFASMPPSARRTPSLTVPTCSTDGRAMPLILPLLHAGIDSLSQYSGTGDNPDLTTVMAPPPAPPASPPLPPAPTKCEPGTFQDVRPSTVSLECLARTRRLSESSLPTLRNAGSQATLRAAPSVRKNSTRGRLEDPSAAQPPTPTERGHNPFKDTCGSCKVLQAARASSIDIPESSVAPSTMPVSCCTVHQEHESFYV